MNSINKRFRILIPLLCLVAVCLHSPAQTPDSEPADSKTETEILPSREEKLPPQTSVQIVNATSVPEISLMVDKQMYYPEFPQGLYTGDAPTPKLNPSYTATDLITQTKVTEKISYDADTHQSLIITGDFQFAAPETDAGQDSDAAVSTKSGDEKDKLDPRVNFLVLSHDLEAGEEPLRYRFHNGLVDEKIIINNGTTGQWVSPNQTLTFHGQPMVKTFLATIDKKTFEVLIRQEGGARNCTVVFYEKEGKPTFMRAFENTSKPLRVVDQNSGTKNTTE